MGVMRTVLLYPLKEQNETQELDNAATTREERLMQSSGIYHAAYTMVSENEQRANRLLPQTATNRALQGMVRQVPNCQMVGMAELMSSAVFLQLKLRHFACKCSCKLHMTLAALSFLPGS